MDKNLRQSYLVKTIFEVPMLHNIKWLDQGLWQFLVAP